MSMAFRTVPILACALVGSVGLAGCIDRGLAVPVENQQPGQQEIVPGSGPTATPTPDDMDGDGIPNSEDDCPVDFNPDQKDSDGDGVGDACDDCPNVADPEQGDENNNGVGDACEQQPDAGFHIGQSISSWPAPARP